MSGKRVSDVVTWPVVWPRARGPVRRFLASALNVPSGGFGPATGATTQQPSATRMETVEDVELAGGLHAEVALERIVAEDPAGVLRDVILTQEDAAVEGLPTYRLRAAEVLEAEFRGEGDPRRADAVWELTVLQRGTRLTLYGPWASFAWLGHLAGWPVPRQGEARA